MPDSEKILETKKFMRDGETYDTRAAAEEVENKYKTADFETRILEEDGKFLVYNRREVKEVVVEGSPTWLVFVELHKKSQTLKQIQF